MAQSYANVLNGIIPHTSLINSNLLYTIMCWIQTQFSQDKSNEIAYEIISRVKNLANVVPSTTDMVASIAKATLMISMACGLTDDTKITQIKKLLLYDGAAFFLATAASSQDTFNPKTVISYIEGEKYHKIKKDAQIIINEIMRGK